MCSGLKVLAPALALAFLLWKSATLFDQPSPPLLAILLGYFLGSLPFGYLAGRLSGTDLRRQGSGNIGTANAARVLGRKIGAAVLLLDLLKGFAACWLASWILPGEEEARRLAILAGIASVLGHDYTCWLGFRGGKGIATSAGAFLWLSPLCLPIPLAAFVLLVALTRIVSVGSMGAALALPLGTWIAEGQGLLLEAALLIGLLAVYQHRDNLRRLRKGTEAVLGRSGGS